MCTYCMCLCVNTVSMLPYKLYTSINTQYDNMCDSTHPATEETTCVSPTKFKINFNIKDMRLFCEGSYSFIQ